MKIEYCKNMVNISTEHFEYGNIKNMYKGNRNGAGIQVSKEMQEKSEDIGAICDQIAALIYQLDEIGAIHHDQHPSKQNSIKPK